MPIQLRPPNGDYEWMCQYCGRQWRTEYYTNVHEQMRCPMRFGAQPAPISVEEETLVTVDFSE